MSTDREDTPVTGIEDQLRLALHEALRSRDLDDRAAIIRTEITDRRAAAREYELAGHPDRADRLRLEAETLRSVLETSWAPT